MGPNPTDRANGGVKRSVMCDANGMPLGLVIDGANTHDVKLFLDTLLSVPIDWPDATAEHPQHLCLDAAYDAACVERQIYQWELIPHIRSRGEERKAKRKNPAKKARRWVVERLHSWLNRYRRLLVRWEKKLENFQAMLHFAFALILLRSARLSQHGQTLNSLILSCIDGCVTLQLNRLG